MRSSRAEILPRSSCLAAGATIPILPLLLQGACLPRLNLAVWDIGCRSGVMAPVQESAIPRASKASLLSRLPPLSVVQANNLPLQCRRKAIRRALPRFSVEVLNIASTRIWRALSLLRILSPIAAARASSLSLRMLILTANRACSILLLRLLRLRRRLRPRGRRSP